MLIVPGQRATPVLSTDDLLAAIETADLRGRGGAGFPVARKLRAVRDQAAAARRTPVAVANGEEGEPGSAKDRFLLRHRPDQVLEGLALAGQIIGAETAYIYLSDAESARCIEAALARRSVTAAGSEPHMRIAQVEHAYVAGEESAVVRRINGGPALPVTKPPRPFEKGVGDAPTLIANVETLYRIAELSRGERVDRLLVTVSGADQAPRLYDVPEGTPLRAVLEAHIGPGNVPGLRGVMLGGLFGGVHTPEVFDTPLGFDAMTAAGAALGCGAIHLIGPEQCPVAVVRNALNHLAEESSRQCGICVTGTARLAATLTRAARGAATTDDRDALHRWSGLLPGRGACGLLDAAARLAGSLARNFPGTLGMHLVEPCPVDPGCAVHGPWGVRPPCRGCARPSGPSNLAVTDVPHHPVAIDRPVS